jgi:hypothetical protein
VSVSLPPQSYFVLNGSGQTGSVEWSGVDTRRFTSGAGCGESDLVHVTLVEF